MQKLQKFFSSKTDLLISTYFIKNILVGGMILNCTTFITLFIEMDICISSHWEVGAQGIS